jgi:tetratricopeptide (TPR) repeat protein
MSDPSVKGAKRSSSRPAPHSASQKSSAKGRKVTAKSAKPKPKRAAAEKAPVRKASPAKSPKSTTASKSSRPAAKQSSKRPAAKPAPAKKAAGKAHAPTKSAAAKGKAASRPQPAKSPTKSASKSAPSKTSKAQASKSAAVQPQRPATRHAPQQPRQPSRDEAAALKAFERAHKEFARGNFTTARDLFRSLIDQHGGVSEVTARARTYLTIADARLQREAALPRDPDSLYDRGVIELNRGDFVAAQELFERALKRDPDAADTHYALAATRARLGAIEAALQALERAVELKHVLRVRAQSDADLAPLRNDPEFERIVFSNTRP